MVQLVQLVINNRPVSVEAGTTILEAARQADIYIPSLCYLKDIHKFGSCRMCVVDVAGAKNLQASCIATVREGMVVKTNTPEVLRTRKLLYEMLISNHPKDCLSCSRNQSCELQQIGNEIGADTARFEGERSVAHLDITPSITKDTAKCILCRRCVTVCNNIQQIGAINIQNRGFKSVISPAMELPLKTVDCTYCGQCTVVCPVGALKETDGISPVWKALEDPTKRVIVQPAPAVRVAIAEEFNLPPGTLATGKLAAALKALGFDDVFDTNFGADLTIMEEGTEFLSRVQSALTGGDAVLPMMTSCSPGWIKYIEHFYPKQLSHLSSCKSPHTMLGAVIKSFYANQIGVDPKDIFVVSVMPCTAKKYEITRPEMEVDGCPDVDAVITTRELAAMIKQADIDFASLEDSEFDDPMGMSTGAAAIFGVTGGVMEAALRTVYELVTGREIGFDKLHVTPIVGLEQIKEATLKIENALPAYSFLEGVEVKIAVTSGFAGAKKLMAQIEAGTSPYHFIEVMGCPGGCITGGGQPRPKNMDIQELRKIRLAATYTEDEKHVLRKSHENPALQKLYAEFLGEPGGHLSHKLLHTTYSPRGHFNEYLKADKN